MSKELYFDDDGRKKLLNGIEKISKAVKTTLGPCGRMVMMDKKFSSPVITKDGVSVAKEIELEDAVENMGAKFVREVASKTNDDAGDGTTTSTVIAYALIRDGLRAVSSGATPIEVKRGMEKGLNAVVADIKSKARPIETRKDLVSIASISANNDYELGELIADAFDKVGKEGIVTVEESKTTETKVKTVEGMQFDRGYISSYFVNNHDRMECVFENPYILITDKKISTMRELMPILEPIVNEGRSLLIIADDVEGEALTTLVLNTIRGTIKVCCVKTPMFGEQRKNLLNDIAILTNGEVICDEVGLKIENAPFSVLGSAKSVIVGKDSTTIVDGCGDSERIKERISEIKNSITKTESTYEKEQLEKRLAKISGGVAVIEVGAISETEMKEKKFRVEDTINATRAALEDGIVSGGGLTLIDSSKVLDSVECNTDDEKIGIKILKSAMEEPMKQIADNAGVVGSMIVAKAKESEYGIGYDAKNDRWCNLIDNGIIDPCKVTCSAIKNAVSVASTVLTTECVVIDTSETKEPQMM